jgi:hypothetical protein
VTLKLAITLLLTAIVITVLTPRLGAARNQHRRERHVPPCCAICRGSETDQPASPCELTRRLAQPESIHHSAGSDRAALLQWHLPSRDRR